MKYDIKYRVLDEGTNTYEGNTWHEALNKAIEEQSGYGELTIINVVDENGMSIEFYKEKKYESYAD